jgi:hypothetical protein
VPIGDCFGDIFGSDALSGNHRYCMFKTHRETTIVYRTINSDVVPKSYALPKHGNKKKFDK